MTKRTILPFALRPFFNRNQHREKPSLEDLAEVDAHLVEVKDVIDPVMEPDLNDIARNDKELGLILYQAAKNQDQRPQTALVSLSDIQATEDLLDELRRINLRLDSIDKQFDSKNVAALVKDALVLQDSLYLEPEKIKGYTNRFLAAYVRAGASYQQNLGFFQRLEEYLAKELQVPKTLIQPLEPKQTLTRYAKKEVLPKALDLASIAGGFAVGLSSGLNGLGILLVAGTFYGVGKVTRWGMAKTDQPPTYKHVPDIHPTGYDHPTGYFSCEVSSEEYALLAAAYAERKGDLRESVLQEGRKLLDSVNDPTISRTCKKEKQYTDQVLQRSRSLNERLTNVVQAAEHYDSTILERLDTNQKLERKQETEKHLRGL